MSKVPATVRSLRAAAVHAKACADSLKDNGALLMRFYSVECGMKHRYLSQLPARPTADTNSIPPSAFGEKGHDLAAGLKAIRAPALLGKAPPVWVNGQSHTIEHAHQVWRYHIPHEGQLELDSWLRSVESWLEAK